MNNQWISKWLLRIAVAYALAGIGLGVVMAASMDFTHRGIHVHANLVGWVSMAVMALCYKVMPALENSMLAKIQFYAHNLGLPVMLLGIYGVLHNLPFGAPCAGVGSIVVAIAFVCFAINVWKNAGATLRS